MSRTWTKVETMLWRHPKTRALARLWQTKPYTICGFLLAIWDYMLEHQPDGNVNAIPDADLQELIAPCLSEAIGVLDVPRDSLVTSGWVDADGYWHDWHEYAGALIARRQKERNRKRKYREKKKLATDDSPTGQARVSRVVSRGRPAPRVESRVDTPLPPAAHAAAPESPAWVGPEKFAELKQKLADA
jgi:hypothetical protein